MLLFLGHTLPFQQPLEMVYEQWRHHLRLA